VSETSISRPQTPNPKPLFQAEEFAEGIAKDELQSVVSQAAASCPGHTLALLVEGLEHYLTLRQRRDFQVLIRPPCHLIYLSLLFSLGEWGEGLIGAPPKEGFQESRLPSLI